MPAIRKRTAACALAAILVQSVLTPLAMAEDFMTASDNQPRLMLYVSKAFGEKSKLRKAPQFGLRFERSIDIGGLREDRNPIFAKQMSLVDLRWTKGYGRSLHLLDVPLYRSPLQLNSTEVSSSEESSAVDSLSADSIGTKGKVIFGFAAVLAILCATNTIICEKSDYEAPTSDGPATGG
jgi:hypothetical protein